MFDKYIFTRKNVNPYKLYKKYKEGDYILTNYFTKRNSYLVKIHKINYQYDDFDSNIIISISSILVKIPKLSLKAGLDKDIKDEFKSFITNNCYHREFCLCEKEEPYKNKCKKCNCLIYNNIELKKKNSIINKFYQPKSLSRPFPISFLNEFSIASSMSPSIYHYIKSMLFKKEIKEITTCVSYFIKLTPEECRYYIKKYLSINQFCLFLFSQKNGFYLPYSLNRYIYSFC